MSARERKVITVLFADLVGFTSRSEKLDPEDVEAVLRPYHERLRYDLERWGGTVEKFIGDAVMALFGAPVTRENDPERAVRAALSIRDWIAEEGKLQVRIAVNTGEALVNLGARPEAGEGMAAGDVVNTAARLQSAAPVNGILVGETTYRATAETIDYREHAAVDAKGKEDPIPVWEVAQAHAAFGVDLAPQTRTPLVGREREREQLIGALERARQQSSTELVTLVGVPGIGKSRLVGELFQWIDGSGKLTYWRQGRSLPYGEGVSYWALGEMVKAQAGILETDGDDEVVSKLTHAVEQLIDEDAEWVLSHLRPLVGQASDASGPQEEAFAAWRRFFEALAERNALVLVFEDIQWADDGLLDFIEHLVDWVRGVPMLILCTARLELLERRPAWGGGKVNAATVALAPLSDEETATLISALAERPLMEAETQSALLERAGGNPLYAEQYVRMLAERGSAEDLPLPENVQGIIAARLDSLPPEEKVLLQDAAVIGKVFWLGALAATEQQLHALQQKEFVQRARRSSVEGQTEFSFTHLLVRDVAYGQIPRADRAQKHVHAAEWIESFGRPEDHAEMVAHHYVSALELARAAGQGVDELAERARGALGDAGDRAVALQVHEQALRYYTEALALVEPDDRERLDLLLRRGRARFRADGQGAEDLAEARAGLRAAGDPEHAAEAALLLASIAWYAGQRDQAMTELDDARSLVAGRPPSRVQARVLAEISHYAMLAANNETAITVGREALKMAEELGLDNLRAEALNNIGTARFHSGDLGGIRDVEESLSVAEQAKDIPAQIRARNNIGIVHLVLGDRPRAEEGILEAQRLGLHFGHRGFARWSSGGPVLTVRYLRGEWEELVSGAEEFLADETPSYQESSALVWRGMLRVARGDLDGAQSDAERAIELVRPAKDLQAIVSVFAAAAMTFLSAGNETRAGQTLDELLAEVRELPQIGVAAFWAHAWTWVGQGLGRSDEVLEVLEGDPMQTPWLDAARAIADRDFRQAADLIATTGWPAFEMFYRLQSGTEQDLRAALDFYRRVGATRYVREGEALLAATA